MSLADQTRRPQLTSLNGLSREAPALSSAPESKSSNYPPSHFAFACHPLADQISNQVHEYFLQHWNFPNEQSREKFVRADLPRSGCLSFPTAKDDRIYPICHGLVLKFLIDDFLDDVSIEEGRAWVDRLERISSGEQSPDRSIPIEWITYDGWEIVRAVDGELAEGVIEGAMIWFRSAMTEARCKPMTFGQYLDYREADIGGQYMYSLLRFGLGLRLSPGENALVQPAEHNYVKQMAGINDFYSLEKEALIAKTAPGVGKVLFNCIPILGKETGLSTDAAKRVVLHICREWELRQIDISRQVLEKKDTPELRAYLQGLQDIMSGGEEWSKKTARYMEP